MRIIEKERTMWDSWDSRTIVYIMSVNAPTHTPSNKTAIPKKTQLTEQSEITHPEVSAALNKALIQYKTAHRTENKNFQYNQLSNANRYLNEAIELARSENIAIPQHIIDATMDGRAIEPHRSKLESTQTPEDTNVISFGSEKIGVNSELLKLIYEQRTHMQQQIDSLDILARVTRENVEQMSIAA